MVLPLVHHATTKLIVKYPPLAVKESVVDHACKVSNIVLVVDHSEAAGNHVSPKLAYPVDDESTVLGGNRTPSQVPHGAWICRPLTLISNILFDEPVEIIFKVPVELKVIPVGVAHPILVAQVETVPDDICSITLAVVDPVFPARSLNVNVKLPFPVNNFDVVFCPVSVSDQLSVARTFAQVLVYITFAVGAILSIQVTVAVLDPVFPTASW